LSLALSPESTGHRTKAAKRAGREVNGQIGNTSRSHTRADTARDSSEPRIDTQRSRVDAAAVDNLSPEARTKARRRSSTDAKQSASRSFAHPSGRAARRASHGSDQAVQRDLASALMLNDPADDTADSPEASADPHPSTKAEPASFGVRGGKVGCHAVGINGEPRAGRWGRRVWWADGRGVSSGAKKPNSLS
jgi:hypothetical protein